MKKNGGKDNRNNDKNQNISGVKLRMVADKLRKTSERIRNRAPKTSELVLESVKEFKRGFDGGLEIYSNVLDAMRAGSFVIGKVIEQPTIKAKTKDLIENVCDDVAKRINEFSNILDYISKDEELVAAMKEGRDKMKASMKAAEKIAKKISTKKSNLNIVTNEDEDTTLQ